MTSVVAEQTNGRWLAWAFALLGAVCVASLAYTLAAVYEYTNAIAVLILIALSPLAGGYTNDDWATLSIIWAAFNGVLSFSLLLMAFLSIAKRAKVPGIGRFFHPALALLLVWVVLVLLCPIPVRM